MSFIGQLFKPKPPQCAHDWRERGYESSFVFDRTGKAGEWKTFVVFDCIKCEAIRMEVLKGNSGSSNDKPQTDMEHFMSVVEPADSPRFKFYEKVKRGKKVKRKKRKP